MNQRFDRVIVKNDMTTVACKITLCYAIQYYEMEGIVMQ